MRIPIYQVDAFTDQLFAGNPAAVCPLEEPITAPLMQSIAIENQLSETAFLLRNGNSIQLRWFTPGGEVNLCGHATLAAGHVLLSEIEPAAKRVEFETASGTLTVERAESGYTLDLPAWPGTEVPVEESWIEALGIGAKEARPRAARRTERDIYLLFDTEAEVRALAPDFRALARIQSGDVLIDGVGVAAPGETVDVVSRFFAPLLGIDEDPVTGSAHSTWVPWFADMTQKTSLTCRQISKRGGKLTAHLVDNRVRLSGSAVTYLRGEIEV